MLECQNNSQNGNADYCSALMQFQMNYSGRVGRLKVMIKQWPLPECCLILFVYPLYFFSKGRPGQLKFFYSSLCLLSFKTSGFGSVMKEVSLLQICKFKSQPQSQNFIQRLGSTHFSSRWKEFLFRSQSLSLSLF